MDVSYMRNLKRQQVKTRLLAIVLVVGLICMIIYANDNPKPQKQGSQMQDETSRLWWTPVSIREYLPINHTFHEPSSTNERKLNLQYLAAALTAQIEHLSSSNCRDGFSLLCGHFQGCGLGCQLHHRATCLMLSYTMGIPLIHDSVVAWPFDDPWETVYQRLGSNCSVNDGTIVLKWNGRNGPELKLKRGSSSTMVEYPFRNGIPVDRELLELIEANHPRPFRWFVGQFLKYTVRLSNVMKPHVEEWLQKLPESQRLGFHVRRTDKTREAEDSHHELSDYFKASEDFFQNHTESVRYVYIASDDHTVLTEARKKYLKPNFIIIGQELNQTFRNSKERHSKLALRSIVTDVSILSQCDYVVCGLSSNVCRLILELMSADHLDGTERIRSLDQYYRYVLQPCLLPEKLIPFDSNKWK